MKRNLLILGMLMASWGLWAPDRVGLADDFCSSEQQQCAADCGNFSYCRQGCAADYGLCQEAHQELTVIDTNWVTCMSATSYCSTLGDTLERLACWSAIRNFCDSRYPKP